MRYLSLTPNTSPSYLLAGIICNLHYFSFRIYHTPTLYIPRLPKVDIYTVNLSPTILEFSRNKQISSRSGQEHKTHTNTPPPEESFTNTVVEHTKKF